MALLRVCLLPDPVLREIAQPVAEVTPEILTLLDDMLDTMYHEVGIGLAAPQVDVLKRVVVMDIFGGRGDGERQPIKLINPKIVAASDELSLYDEGCLSIPQMNGEVMRPADVTVQYMDIDGETQTVEMSGLAATCIQHEIDHLNGKLFIDYLTPLKRNILLRRYNKRQQNNHED